MKSYSSNSGYIAVLSIVFFSYILMYMQIKQNIPDVTNKLLFSMLFLVFLIMLLNEYFFKTRYNSKNNITVKFRALSKDNKYILKSTFFRFIALLMPLLIASSIVFYMPYFTDMVFFRPTVLFFKYILILYIVVAPIYMYLTLKFRGDRFYEFNDYAILTMIGFRSLFKYIYLGNKNFQLYKNRRVKKIFLVFVVNFFFITLMARFFSIEYAGFQKHILVMIKNDFFTLDWYTQVRNTYFVLFHTLFLIDVGIGIIGYASASRWLGNRTKSVDMTISGWFFALFAYPPFNSFFYTYILPYNNFQTTDVITSQIAWSIIFVILLILYTIYVWGTAALGFKFSNLTNRGIVTRGPYKYVRHPAYASKNIAWLIDYNYLLSNILAFITFLGWTAVYVLRGVTEEKHLSKDKAYREYKKNVKYMFIPKVI